MTVAGSIHIIVIIYLKVGRSALEWGTGTYTNPVASKLAYKYKTRLKMYEERTHQLKSAQVPITKSASLIMLTTGYKLFFFVTGIRVRKRY
jgi:hypothetical protein